MVKNNIAIIRKSRGLTQKQLAQELEISHWWLNHIENDIRNPSLKLAKNIAETLKVPLKDIFLD